MKFSEAMCKWAWPICATTCFMAVFGTPRQRMFSMGFNMLLCIYFYIGFYFARRDWLRVKAEYEAYLRENEK